MLCGNLGDELSVSWIEYSQNYIDAKLLLSTTKLKFIVELVSKRRMY